MTGWLQSIVGHPIAVAIIGIASIGSMLYTISDLIAKHRQKLYVEHRTQVLFPGFRYGESERVVVQTGGRAALKLSRDVYLFVNRTKRVITTSDFVEMPVLKSGHNASILQAWAENHPFLAPAKIELNDGSVRFSEIMLRPRGAIIVQILHDGTLESRFEAILKEQPDLLYVNRAQRVPALFSGMIAGVSSALIIVLLFSQLPLPDTRLASFVAIVATVILSGVLVSLSIRLFEKLVQGRTESEDALDALMSADTMASLVRFNGRR